MKMEIDNEIWLGLKLAHKLLKLEHVECFKKKDHLVLMPVLNWYTYQLEDEIWETIPIWHTWTNKCD